MSGINVRFRKTEARIESFAGSAEESLNVPANTFGKINFIGEHGGGVVRMSFDGTNPNTDASFEMNARQTLNLENVRLDLVRLNGTANNSDYSIAYEIYL